MEDSIQRTLQLTFIAIRRNEAVVTKSAKDSAVLNWIGIQPPDLDRSREYKVDAVPVKNKYGVGFIFRNQFAICLPFLVISSSTK